MNLTTLLSDPRLQQQIWQGGAVMLSGLAVLGVLLISCRLSKTMRQVKILKGELASLLGMVASSKAVDLTLEMVTPKVREPRVQMEESVAETTTESRTTGGDSLEPESWKELDSIEPSRMDRRETVREAIALPLPSAEEIARKAIRTRGSPRGQKDLERHVSGGEPVEPEYGKDRILIEPLKMSAWRESLPAALAHLPRPSGEEPARKQKRPDPERDLRFGLSPLMPQNKERSSGTSWQPATKNRGGGCIPPDARLAGSTDPRSDRPQIFLDIMLVQCYI